MRKNYKSVLAVALSVGMVLQTPVLAFANEGDTQETPANQEAASTDATSSNPETTSADETPASQENASTDEIPAVLLGTSEAQEIKQADQNSYVGYDVRGNGFNAFGINTSGGPIQTTCGNYGYATNVLVDENLEDENPSRLPGGSSFQYGSQYDINGIKTSIVANIADADSNAVQITYILTNDTETDKTVKVGSNADTKIGDQDKAPCSFIGDGVGIKMTDGTNTFVLLPGGDDFTTSWYGSCGRRSDNQFVDLDKSSETFSSDSGIAWSWTVDVPSGGTVTRTAVLAAGELTVYNVSYDANGGEGTMKGNAVIDGYNNEITLKDCEYKREGYSFEGWSLDAEDIVNILKAGDTYRITSAQQFYAIWKLIAPDVPVPAPAVVEEIISGESSDEEIQVVPSTDGFTVITTQAQEALPTKELGNAEAVTRTAKVNISKVTPAQYVDIVKSTVSTVPAGGVAVIETDEVSVLDANMIEVFAERSDVAINIVFKHDGVKKRVVIPAGYDVRSLLDENGYCGFLKLAEILGFTILED